MDLKEFHANLIEQIRSDSTILGTSDREEFVNQISYMLIEAEELDDSINFVHFEGVGRKGRKIQIDGYTSLETNFEKTLTIYVVPDLNYDDDLITLTGTDAMKWLSRARAFVEDSKFIQENSEPSAPAYGLSWDIDSKYKDVKKIYFYILTDSLMSKTLKTLSAEKLGTIPVEYHIWDINRLWQLYESQNGKEDIIINLKEYTDYGIPCLLANKTDDYTAYLCNIPGLTLAKLYNQYGGRLLEGNVRSFLQTKGKVNKGIRSTILNEPDMFFAYNNGIAATAYDLKTESQEGVTYISEITALQIVNGGQTTASLANCLLNDKKDDSEDKIKCISVPMKISIVSPEKAQEMIPNISKYANSQNNVTDADFWSNHPYHMRMEALSRKIIAPAEKGAQYGTHWYYERAKGQYKQATYKMSVAAKRSFEQQNPRNKMFTKTDLAKYVLTKLQKPNKASLGGQKSFAAFAEYVTAAWKKDEDAFNELYFKETVAFMIIFKQTDRLVNKQDWYNGYKINIVEYTISLMLYIIETKYPDLAIDYQSIWLKQELSEVWCNQLIDIATIIDRFLKSDDRGTGNISEWAKTVACWDKAKELNVELSSDFISTLIPKQEAIEKKGKAKKEQKELDKLEPALKFGQMKATVFKDLLDWDKTHNFLHGKDKNLIFLAFECLMYHRKFPTDAQCSKILEILEKARLEAFPG